MTLFEQFVLTSLIKLARRDARRQPKKRARHMRTVIRCKRSLRRAA